MVDGIGCYVHGIDIRLQHLIVILEAQKICFALFLKMGEGICPLFGVPVTDCTERHMILSQDISHYILATAKAHNTEFYNFGHNMPPLFILSQNLCLTWMSLLVYSNIEV